jgi:hypothetical protein
LHSQGSTWFAFLKPRMHELYGKLWC